MLAIIGSFRIGEGKLEEARPAMEKVVRLSSAEKGCRLYAYSADLLDPTLIRISEEWESLEDLQAHAKSDHLAEWRTLAPGFGVSERKVTLHTVSDSKAI